MKKVYLFLLSLPLFLSGCKESEAIAVIGGADGPTAVLVSNNVPRLLIELVILTVLVCIVVFRIIKRKKK